MRGFKIFVENRLVNLWFIFEVVGYVNCELNVRVGRILVKY